MLGAISLTSCALHSGYMNNSAALNQANFDYVERGLTGSASTTKVIGIGGLGKSAIVDEAKRDMLKNNSLKANQALANVTVNWKRSFLILVEKNKCTVTADVIEFK